MEGKELGKAARTPHAKTNRETLNNEQAHSTLLTLSPITRLLTDADIWLKNPQPARDARQVVAVAARVRECRRETRLQCQVVDVLRWQGGEIGYHAGLPARDASPQHAP